MNGAVCPRELNHIYKRGHRAIRHPQALFISSTMAATAQEPQKVTIENVENPDKAPMVAPKKKHTMTATWHLDEDQSEWDFYKRLIHRLNILQHPKGQAPAPVYTKDDKVPFYPVWRQWAYIMPRAVVPLLIHRAFMELTGWTFHPVFAFFFYAFAFKFFAIRCVRVFNRMGQKYGFFDGSHPRDGVPDLHSQKIGLSMLGTVTIRPLFATFLIYDRYEKPSLSLWFPVQMFIYSAVLDFWFYWYHRGMHEIPWLWKFHRLHHVTKHPNPLLSAFADNEQEWGDILVIPLLTWLVFP